MKFASLTAISIVLPVAILPARAADDFGVQRMVTCQDSWLDWQKTDPAQLKKLGEHIRSDFLPQGNEAFLVPRDGESIAGFRVTQVFPQSVGMGAGFSVTVAAPLDQARRSFEKVLGKPLVKCETGDGMRSCALEIAEKRTFTLTAEASAQSTTTLAGCYYYYEK